MHATILINLLTYLLRLRMLYCSEMIIRDLEVVLQHVYFMLLLACGVTASEFRRDLWQEKRTLVGLSGGEKKIWWYVPPFRQDRRTAKWTDSRHIAIGRAEKWTLAFCLVIVINRPSCGSDRTIATSDSVSWHCHCRKLTTIYQVKQRK